MQKGFPNPCVRDSSILFQIRIESCFLRKWKVSFDRYRETWTGHDQNDGSVTVEVMAGTAKSAIKKAIKTELNPGKGMKWSHRIWAKNERAILA